MRPISRGRWYRQPERQWMLSVPSYVGPGLRVITGGGAVAALALSGVLFFASMIRGSGTLVAIYKSGVGRTDENGIAWATEPKSRRFQSQPGLVYLSIALFAVGVAICVIGPQSLGASMSICVVAGLTWLDVEASNHLPPFGAT